VYISDVVCDDRYKLHVHFVIIFRAIFTLFRFVFVICGEKEIQKF
jgi:hypothetical protein